MAGGHAASPMGAGGLAVRREEERPLVQDGNGLERLEGGRHG